jgi:hypothetical protein
MPEQAKNARLVLIAVTKAFLTMLFASLKAICVSCRMAGSWLVCSLFLVLIFFAGRVMGLDLMLLCVVMKVQALRESVEICKWDWRRVRIFKQFTRSAQTHADAGYSL